MSVRLRTWTDKKTGKEKKAWQADVQVTLPDGTPKRKRETPKINTKKEAEILARKIREKLVNPPALPTPLFQDAINKFLTQHVNVFCAKSTQVRYKHIFSKYLLPEFFGKKLEELTTQLIDAYVQKNPTVHPKTMIINLMCLSSLLSKAVDWKMLASKPKINYPKYMQKPVEFFSLDEINQLLDTATEPTRTLLLMALSSGLRRAELRALQWDCIDFQHGNCTVARSAYFNELKEPKSYKVRIVALDPCLIESLQNLPKTSQFVFPGRNGKILSEAGMAHRIQAVAKKLGFSKKIHWHAMRHTFASQLALTGVDVTSVQELLGHSDIKTTSRYVHVTNETKRNAIERLGRLIRDSLSK